MNVKFLNIRQRIRAKLTRYACFGTTGTDRAAMKDKLEGELTGGKDASKVTVLMTA